MNEIDKGERRIIVAIVLTGSFISVLSQTVLTSALPVMMRDFNVTANIGQWLTTAYLLVLGVTVPITAFLIRRFTTRHLYLAAMGLFLLGCILSIFAQDIGLMVLSRMVQAVGGGILTQMVVMVLLSLYPVEARGAAMGLVGLTVGFAPAVGPTLAGFIIVSSGWRGLFYLLAALSFLDMAVAFFFLKNVGKNGHAYLDLLSFFLSTVGFGGLLIAASNQGIYGSTSFLTTFPLLAGLTSLFLFIRRQLRVEKPLLDLRVFRKRDFTVSTVILSLSYASMMSASILVSIYVQSIRGYSAVDTGLLMLPGALLLAILSPVTGRILDTHGPRLLSITGMLLYLVGTFAFSRLDTDTSMAYLSLMYALRMVGLVSILSPVSTWGLNSLTSEEIPHGSAVSNTLRQVSGAIGSAILVTVMTNSSASSLADGAPFPEILGINFSSLMSAMILAVGLLVILLFVRSPKERLSGAEEILSLRAGTGPLESPKRNADRTKA